MKANRSEGWSDYSQYFSSTDDVTKYDALFESDACEHACWGVQRPLLLSVLRDLHGGDSTDASRALDFACGTGRVTVVVRDAGWDVVGLDASPAMIEPARARLPDVEFREGLLGDAETDQWLAGIGGFQLITAFRFFLNASAADRGPILQLLAAQLAATGRLVVNNHGSGPSLRNLGLRVRRKAGSTMIAQRDFVTMLTDAGLHVERQWGGQIFARSLYGAPVVGGVCRAVERLLPRSTFGRRFVRQFGANQMYVCRRA
jgi:SAM-dependent methyltransferase